MKAIHKKLLLATVATATFCQPYFVHAEEINPENTSDNTITIEEDNYTVNSQNTTYSDDNISLNTKEDSSISKNASNNNVTINSGNWKFIAAARSYSGNVFGNYLTINGGKDIQATSGYNLFGGYSISGDVTNNSITVNDGSLFKIAGGYSQTGNVTGNTLTINGGTFDSFAAGGIAFRTDGSIGTVSNNTVTLNNGKVYHLIGGGIVESGTGDETVEQIGTVSNNNVIINGGTVTDGITGAEAVLGSATNNTISIYGGTISGNVVGGYAEYFDSESDITKNSVLAQNNTINIYNNPDLTNAFIRGGVVGEINNLSGGMVSSHSTNDFTGNTLNIYSKGLTAKNIASFENLNFIFPTDIANGDTILTLTDSSGTDLSSTKINVTTDGATTLKTGDTINLLTNTNAEIIDSDFTYSGSISKGISANYDLSVAKSSDGQSMVATIGELKGVSEKTEVITPKVPIFPDIPELPTDPTFPEFDLDDEDFGEDTAKDVGDTSVIENKGWEIFGDFGGGSMRYDTANGGHVDTTSQNVDMGMARNVGNVAHVMTLAPLLDYQNTNYDSYLPDGTHGRGNSKYTGAGIVLRNFIRNGFYYEGSFRVGRVKTDFASDNLDTTGEFGTITYNTSATVWNGHLKFGRYFRLNKNNLLDVYGQYQHSYQGSADADLSSGEHYSFSSANSGRFKIGYRLTTRTSKISQIYTGLAYQYERMGGVSAKYQEYSTSGDSYGGSSGMLEFGWVIRPLKNNPWAVDINTTGWIGHQRGVKAYAKILKSF